MEAAGVCARFATRRWVFAAGALAVACSAGGGGGSGGDSTPAVTFGFTAGVGTLAEGGTLVVSVELQTTRPALMNPAAVDVVDRGTGSATAGTDYPVLAPQTLTFPAGAVDGDVLTVTLGALTDQLVEGASETIELELANPSGGELESSSFTATLDDADHATIAFTLAADATPDESSTPRAVMLELDLAPGVALGVPATMEVRDVGTGSATSGADFVAFVTETVSFAAGSADGTTRTVTVQVVDDASAELDETVQLVLQNPSAGTLGGPTSAHELTITDDDGSGPAALVVTEGASGTESGVAHDDLLDLGSQTVGAGPNAGTRVRISNTGGTPMQLGAPVLRGADPEDFAVELELAPLTAPVAVSAQLGPDVAPLLSAAQAADGVGLALAFDADRLAQLAPLQRATLHGFPLPGYGDVTLDLQRISLPIAEGAALYVNGALVPGGPRSVLEGLSAWRGSVLEIPDSRAFVTLSSEGPRGFLELPFGQRRLVHLTSAVGAQAPGVAACRVVHEADLAAAGIVRPALPCAEARLVPGTEPVPLLDAAPSVPVTSEALTAADCTLAIETDYQLYEKCGSVAATTAYVTQLIAAVSDQYFTDAQTTLSIAYLGVYSSDADPWTSQDSGGDAGDLLDEFRAAWAPSSWPVQANLAHFISGANLGGGVAYIGALCSSSFGFGVSGNINANIDWGAWTGEPGGFTWDFVVVAHELGHNFGANHTHSYCPPLDVCSTNCSGPTQCSQGTLMSYCHTCGGMDNIDLRFHQSIANVVRQSVESSCLGSSALSGGDWVQYLVRFGPLTATGTRNADLEFTHDAPNAPQPFRIKLRGSAD